MEEIFKQFGQLLTVIISCLTVYGTFKLGMTKFFVFVTESFEKGLRMHREDVSAIERRFGVIEEEQKSTMNRMNNMEVKHAELKIELKEMFGVLHDDILQLRDYLLKSNSKD